MPVPRGNEPPRRLPAFTRELESVIGAAREDAVTAECKRLLELLRARCPGLLPDDRLPPGKVGPEIPLARDAAASMFRLVARQAAGLSTERVDDGGSVVWVQGDDELLVVVDKVVVTSVEGAMAVDIPVRCDEVGEATVRVRFALGSDARPAGLLAATDERPFGPPEVVDAWGEALTAFAWQIVLTTATKLADASGRDADGAGLIPIALRAVEGGIAVQTMARHAFDRRGLVWR
jgi:hypothetical protein